MKTTILISFVVVVLGLYWPKQQPVANTTTDFTRTNSILPNASLSGFTGEKQQILTIQPEAYYSTQHLHLSPPESKYRYKNLQLYPVYASTVFVNHHRSLGPYLTLKEGLAQGKLIITELSSRDSLAADSTDIMYDQASVNNLFIENISSDTIIVLGGEVIQGGKQDRMIARDFLVTPNSGKVDIAVYCVEHGRWTDSLNLQFDVAVGFAPTTVREAIFIAVPDEEELLEVPPTQQAEVWKQVAELQEDLKVVSPTDALVEAMEDTKISTVIQPYQDFFNSVQWPVNVVGVVAVLNNEIVGCDIFAQHDLFMKYYPDLVPSYSDHVYRAGEKELLSYKEVRSFFMKTFNNDASLAKRLSEKGTQLMHKNKRLHLAVN